MIHPNEEPFADDFHEEESAFVLENRTFEKRSFEQLSFGPVTNWTPKIRIVRNVDFINCKIGPFASSWGVGVVMTNVNLESVDWKDTLFIDAQCAMRNVRISGGARKCLLTVSGHAALDYDEFRPI